jgi:hypothetical protein
MNWFLFSSLDDKVAGNAIKNAINDCREKLKKIQSPSTTISKSQHISSKEEEKQSSKEQQKSNDDSITRTSEKGKTESPVDIEIQIKTGDETAAGTDARVLISLYGEKGEIIDLLLLNSENNKNPFETNKLDIFSFKRQKYIGKVIIFTYT